MTQKQKTPNEKNFENAIAACTKFAHLKNAIKHVVAEHPNCVVDPICIDRDYAYVLVTWYRNNVKHSIDISIKLSERH